MGKKQHSKDRMYVTATEWREEGGGYKGGSRLDAPFRRLPFHCCGINFTPFEDPVCTEDGTVFDILAAVPYVMRFKRHPVSGAPLALKDLIKLNFHKNTDNEFACPVTGKVFTEHTHIVAIRVTGNVYCWEAVDELCIKPKSWKDLLTDEPFKRKDIIHIQDPLNLMGRAIENFDHIKRELRVEVEEDAAAKSCIRNTTEDMQRVLGALGGKEAKDAFAKGGGGSARVEAARMLADAKAAASVSAPAGAPSTSGQPSAIAIAAAGGAAAVATAAAAASAAADAEPVAGGDWRLRGAGKNQNMPHFKPGTSTWDTDITDVEADKRAAKKAAVAAKKPEAVEAARVAAGEAVAKAGRQTPEQWYAPRVKYVEGALTTGAMSRGFTSSSAPVTTKNARQMTRFNRNPDKKGYVRLRTTLGDLNLELHCDMAPRTCENFVALCEMGYYDGTPFHRSIKNFMLQGGDPTGTGSGGESIYGKRFKDECDSRLIHDGRGVVAMANTGKDTNGSQFYITYKSAQHLNFKHTVFARVVGGFDVLTALERVPCDGEDRPKQDVRLLGADVFTNPYREMEEAEVKAAALAARKAAEETAADPSNPEYKVGKWFSEPGAERRPAEVHSGAGKYIAALAPAAQPLAIGAARSAAAGRDADAAAMPPPAKKPKTAAALSDFDSW